MLFTGKKTTATVLAAFNRTLDELREVEQTHAEEARRKQQEAAVAAAEANAAEAEAANARTVAGKLQALLTADGIGGAISTGDYGFQPV